MEGRENQQKNEFIGMRILLRQMKKKKDVSPWAL